MGRREPPEAVLCFCFYRSPPVPIPNVSCNAWLGRSATSERKRQRMIQRSKELTEKLLKLWPFLQNACRIAVIGLTILHPAAEIGQPAYRAMLNVTGGGAVETHRM